MSDFSRYSKHMETYFESILHFIENNTDTYIVIIFCEHCFQDFSGVSFVNQICKVSLKTIRFILADSIQDHLIQLVSHGKIHQILVNTWNNHKFLELIEHNFEEVTLLEKLKLLRM
jgi:hypothetical protein